MINRWFALGGLAWLVAVVGCSSDNEDSDGAGGTSSAVTGGASGVGGGGGTLNVGTGGVGGSTTIGGTGGAAASSGTGGGNAGSSATGGGANACDVTPDQGGCVGEQYTGETTPLDIYVMFDQSCSMSCPASQGGTGLCCMGGPNPRIDQVRDAVRQFLNDPESAGIGIGISYFGYMQAGNTSCDPSDYSRPAVPMGVLPGHAQAILASLDSIQPTGETPTGAAIRGACTYGAQWKQANPTHAVVILLVTDGVPEAPVTSGNGGCTPSIADAAQAAASCFESSHALPVYVLGVGQALDNLNQIAVAGGTDPAHIVSGGDVVAEVLRALNTIRSSAQIPCELSLPQDPTQPINFQEVNVAYCDAAGQNSTFYYVASAPECDPAQGGWFYDDPVNPQQIRLCEATCDRVGVPGGSLLLSVGCTTVVPPPR